MFGFFRSAPTPPEVRYPHHPALNGAMQQAIRFVDYTCDDVVLCSIDGLNAAEVLLVRKYADPGNDGLTAVVGNTLLFDAARSVTLAGDGVDADAARHWDTSLELRFTRQEDREDFESSL